MCSRRSTPADCSPLRGPDAAALGPASVQNGGMAGAESGGDRDLVRRLARVDWKRVAADLDALGHARIPRLLSAAECRSVAALWSQEERFRSHVDMARHRFGEGEYRYFANPLPPPVRALRAALYPPLARIANAWAEMLGQEQRHPPTLKGFVEHCHSAGQKRPTPLLLRYEAGGYNRLHQDLYGSVAFPLQVAVLLSRPEREFRGGEFLLVEGRPRMQSRGEALVLERGEAVVFPNRERPLRGARGYARAQVRHGVSTLHTGVRLTLGIIFHDAR